MGQVRNQRSRLLKCYCPAAMALICVEVRDFSPLIAPMELMADWMAEADAP